MSSSNLMSILLPLVAIAITSSMLCKSSQAARADNTAHLTQPTAAPFQRSNKDGLRLTGLHSEMQSQETHSEGDTVDPGGPIFNLLILSVVRDASSWGKDQDFQNYLNLLLNITQDTANLQLALGLSIADQHAYSDIRCSLAMHTGHAKLGQLCSTQSHKGVAQSDSNTTKLKLSRVTVIHAAEDAHLKGLTQKTKRDPKGQMQRRRGLARVRNQLLFRALRHEDAVLWIDSDIVAAPSQMVPAMIASNKDIITPLCYFPKRGFWRQELAYFDYNVFQGVPDQPDAKDALQIAEGTLFPQRNKQSRYGNITYLDELAVANPGEDFVALSSVGGTMLWVKADVHRDGVVFPTANIVGSEWERQGYIGLETEGICWTAHFLGYKCWGMTHMNILHSELQ